MLFPLYVVYCMATATPQPVVKVSFDLDQELQGLKLVPAFEGICLVEASQSPDFTVHARVTRDPKGPTVKMWLTPTLSEDRGVKVTCPGEPECTGNPQPDDALRAVFTQALDLTLFSHTDGLGYLRIGECEALPKLGCTQLDVESSSGVGLDRFLYYSMALYEDDHTTIANITHRELQLLANGRDSATRGRFRAVGGSAEDTAEYFEELCKEKLKSPPFALVMQIRSPDLRWQTDAPSATTLY